VLKKLGTNDDELGNIANLIVKKAIRNQHQIRRLVVTCEELILQKPQFRGHLLKTLQENHTNRKNLKEEDRNIFLGCAALIIEIYLTMKTTNQVSYNILIKPIKEIIVEIINDKELDVDDGKFWKISFFLKNGVLFKKYIFYKALVVRNRNFWFD
jgi:hypothetical protein